MIGVTGDSCTIVARTGRSFSKNLYEWSGRAICNRILRKSHSTFFVSLFSSARSVCQSTVQPEKYPTMEDKTSSSDSPNRSHNVVVGSGSNYIKPQGRKPHDSAVKFEEYHWYAQRTREEEKNYVSPKLAWREILLRKKNADGNGGDHDVQESHFTEKDFGDASHRLEISDEEWTNASRMFRTASWGAC